MPFPISYSNTLVLNKDTYQSDPNTIVRNILVCLQKVKAARANNDGNVIFFKGGVRLVSSFNILLPITSGRIIVNLIDDEIHVRYLLKFIELLVLSATALVIFFTPLLLFKTKLNLMEISVVIFCCWLWIVGANYLVTTLRFPRFIKKCVSV